MPTLKLEIEVDQEFLDHVQEASFFAPPKLIEFYPKDVSNIKLDSSIISCAELIADIITTAMRQGRLISHIKNKQNEKENSTTNQEAKGVFYTPGGAKNSKN